MPALIFPQLLLFGLFVPRSAMAPLLDVIVVIAAGVAALMLGALTLRRRTA